MAATRTQLAAIRKNLFRVISGPGKTSNGPVQRLQQLRAAHRQRLVAELLRGVGAGPTAVLVRGRQRCVAVLLAALQEQGEHTLAKPFSRDDLFAALSAAGICCTELRQTAVKLGAWVNLT